MDSYDLNRLLAIKDVLADANVEPFDIRDPRQCAYRVLTDIIARDQAKHDSDAEESAARAALLDPSLDGCIDQSFVEAVPACVDRPQSGAPAAGDCALQAAQSHFSFIVKLERRYRALLASGTKPAAEAVLDLPIDFQRLGEVLTAHCGKPVVIKANKLSPGGYSKVTVFSTMEVGHQSRQVVVRCDVGAGIAETSVLDEYPVIKMLHDAGVAVPRPIWAGRLEKAGGAMMVMEQVAGNAFGSPISSIIQDDGLCREMAVHLARLHGVPPSATEFGCSTVDTRSKILSMIESSAVDLGKTGVDSPVHTYAFQWLRDNLHLVGPREAVVHGDYGPHNLLVEDGRVNAILDWEFVKIGHPAEDICWPRLSIEAVGSWEIFLDAYVKAGGIRPTDDELRYFSILGLARISVMQTQIDSAFGEGPATLVRWAAPGVERFRPSMLRLGQMLGLEAA